MPLEHPAILQELEHALAGHIEALPQSRVRQAMGYSLMAGGKRIRPRLLFAVLDAYGVDPIQGMNMACAIEMMHTYSLIHDDMPEMDNDTLRRGRPCCHIVYGDDVAMLAGDGLQSLAFACAADQPEAEKAAKLCRLLAEKSGPAGMVLGQDLDLSASGHTTLEQLEEIEAYKTGCLFELPLCAGAILAGHDEDIPAWKTIGHAMGILFQIQDDLLERTASEEQMGKSLSDARNEKATALSLIGEEEGRRRVDWYFEQIDEQLSGLDLDEQSLRELLDAMKNRTH